MWSSDYKHTQKLETKSADNKLISQLIIEVGLIFLLRMWSPDI